MYGSSFICRSARTNEPVGALYEASLTMLSMHQFIASDDGEVTRIVPDVNARSLPSPAMGDQREALVTQVVRVDTAPIRFATSTNYVEVSVPGSMQLTVNKEMKHDPSCGAMQWFKPFSTLEQSAMGVAETHSFSGPGLGTKWSAPDKRSAFFGTFAY